MNTFDGERRDDSDALSVMLNDLPRVDPPPALLGDVMSAIEQTSTTHANHPGMTFMKRGRTMAKKVLWTVAAAAAAALVIMRVAGYPPVEKGTEATIGAAQRYQAQQISNADVKTGDAQMQAFLQSDLFHRLATDKAARTALKNKDFQRALAVPQVRAALAQPAIRAAIESSGANVLGNAQLDAAAADSLRAALEAAPELSAALAQPEVAAAIAESALSAALAQPAVAATLSNDAAIFAIMSAPETSGAAPGAAPGVAPGVATGAAPQ